MKIGQFIKTDLVFAREDSSPVNPKSLSKRFKQIGKEFSFKTRKGSGIPGTLFISWRREGDSNPHTFRLHRISSPAP